MKKTLPVKLNIWKHSAFRAVKSSFCRCSFCYSISGSHFCLHKLANVYSRGFSDFYWRNYFWCYHLFDFWLRNKPSRKFWMLINPLCSEDESWKIILIDHFFALCDILYWKIVLSLRSTHSFGLFYELREFRLWTGMYCSVLLF